MLSSFYLGGYMKKEKKQTKENLLFIINSLEEFIKLSKSEQMNAIKKLKEEYKKYE